MRQTGGESISLSAGVYCKDDTIHPEEKGSVVDTAPQITGLAESIADTPHTSSQDLRKTQFFTIVRDSAPNVNYFAYPLYRGSSPI